MSLKPHVFFIVTALAACGAPPPSHVKDAFSGKSSYYYDVKDRVELTRQLTSAIDAQYSLVEIKKHRIGLDFDALSKEAIEGESKIADTENSLEQAKGNLDYLDRMQKLIASFEDTHFHLNTVASRPPISNGLVLSLVGDKVYVTTVVPKLLSLAENPELGLTDYSKELLGGRVVSVDGIDVAEAARNLEPYINASSKGFRSIRAVESLSARSFRYPERPYADWEFELKQGMKVKVRLPYHFKKTGHNVDAEAYLSAIGMKPSNLARMEWDESKLSWKQGGFTYVGYEPFQAPKGLIGGVTYFDSEDTETPAMRTGYMIRDGKAFGVIQLFSYAIKDLLVEGSEENQIEFKDAIKTFVSELKKNDTPLVFDLRNNGGGNASLPPYVMSLLAKEGDVYAPQANAFRITRKVRQMYSAIPVSFPNFVTYFDIEEAKRAVEDAIARKDTHTHVFASEAMIKSNKDIGGYDGKIAVLISPRCISACDIQSMLFKSSKRALLIGSHSNGTGAGYMTYSPYNSTGWEDTYGVFRIQIPNFLFGAPLNVEEHRRDALGMTDASLSSENLPVAADIEYHPSLADYENQDAEVFSFAISKLEQP